MLFPFLFLFAVDWIMRESTSEDIYGILWNSFIDLDFADNFAILSHTYDQMQEKTSILAENASKTGLRINKEKKNPTRE